MKFEKRSVFGWPASDAGSASPRNGIAVHYDGSDQGLAKKTHASCRTYWRDTRKFHMGPSRKWADIGYSFAVCPHGIVLEGRGLDHVQAAQPGGNATWYSCTFMSGPTERPTAAQINGFRELRAWLRGKGVAAALRPHSAFISTSCCGDILRKLITNGTLVGAPSSPVQEDDMEPSTRIKIPPFYADKSRTQFDKSEYAFDFLVVGAVAETRRYGKEIRSDVAAVRAELAAQRVTIDKLVEALATGQTVDPEGLKRLIRETVAEALTDGDVTPVAEG